MSASIHSEPHAASPLFSRLRAAIAAPLAASWRREQVGAVSIWDGNANLRLPGAGFRNFFRVSVYVTVRRGPGDDDKGGPPTAAISLAAKKPAPREHHS